MICFRAPLGGVTVLFPYPEDPLGATTEPSEKSQKRAGSPFDDDQINGLIPAIHPYKRLRTDNQPDVTVEPHPVDGLKAAPADVTTATTPALSGDASSAYSPFAAQASLLDNNQHPILSEEEHFDDGLCPGDVLLQGALHAEDFQHQAFMFPTPQTGNFNKDDACAAFELPPLQLHEGSQGEQGRPTLIPKLG